MSEGYRAQFKRLADEFVESVVQGQITPDEAKKALELHFETIRSNWESVGYHDGTGYE